MDELLANCEIKPTVNQIELHPAFRQKRLLPYCQEKNIKVMAYMPLMAGNCRNNKVIKQLAKKHNATPAQICLRWVYQQGAIAIPKSSNPQRVKENAQIEGFELSQEDLSLIDTIKEKKYDWDPRNED
nr:aldo/keto reductase [endosymbiont GvMRE of Glomus versiforme]